MLRPDRLNAAADRLSSASDRLTGAVRGHRKSLAYVSIALALASAGSASAATVSASPPARLASAIVAAAAHASSAVGPSRPSVLASFPVITLPATAKPATITPPAAAKPATITPTAAAKPTASTRPAARPAAVKSAAHTAAQPVAHTVAQPAAHTVTHTAHASAAPWVTWKQVRDRLNWETNPAAAAQGRLPLADRLMPVGTSGPQSWMPVNHAQLANATTIVQQVLAKRMGVRSAVIAVATAMQESKLLNIGYGTEDSLGLFQQQPDCGWGSAQQIMDPVYASDGFLNSLQQYQASNPDWAEQPLWQAAQGVQNSAFPYAYAQWESQAASLVQQIAMHRQ
jgi:hypothetical protein